MTFRGQRAMKMKDEEEHPLKSHQSDQVMELLLKGYLMIGLGWQSPCEETA